MNDKLLREMPFSSKFCSLASHLYKTTHLMQLFFCESRAFTQGDRIRILDECGNSK